MKSITLVLVGSFTDLHCRFGSGSGEIWLSNVECSSDDTNLLSCSHNRDLGVTGCSHTEDVSVSCTTILEGMMHNCITSQY